MISSLLTPCVAISFPAVGFYLYLTPLWPKLAFAFDVINDVGRYCHFEASIYTGPKTPPPKMRTQISSFFFIMNNIFTKIAPDQSLHREQSQTVLFVKVPNINPPMRKPSAHRTFTVRTLWTTKTKHLGHNFVTFPILFGADVRIIHCLSFVCTFWRMNQ